MRLYKALCAALEAYAEAMAAEEEHHPEGAGQAQAEHAHSYSQPPEMHIGTNRQSIDDDEALRRPVGFRRNGDSK